VITKAKPVITGPKRRTGFGLAVVLRMFSTMGSSLFPFLETKAMPAHRTSMRKLKESYD
jgi:hypothetical protein